MRFKRTRRGVEAKLQPVEAVVLARCAEDLLALLGDAETVPDDPIAAMVGLPAGSVRTPEDPALARLLPDAYRPETDEKAAVEFRRYTEVDLRAGKRAAASTVLAHLVPLADGGRLVLHRDDADRWLTWLTDVRLVLGTRLEVTEETEEVEEVDPDDPRAPVLAVYHWLGWLQESLLTCLEPRSLA